MAPYEEAYQVDGLGVLRTRAVRVVGVQTENVREDGDTRLARYALSLCLSTIVLNDSRTINSRRVSLVDDDAQLLPRDGGLSISRVDP